MWDMSFSAAPREARNFSSHDIGGFAEEAAARVEEEEVGAAVFEVVAMVESGLMIFAAAVEVDGFVVDRGCGAGGSDEGGLGLLRTSLKALLSTDTIGATCFVLVEVGRGVIMVVVDDFTSGLLVTVVRGAGTLWSELEAGAILWGTMA